LTVDISDIRRGLLGIAIAPWLEMHRQPWSRDVSARHRFPVSGCRSFERVVAIGGGTGLPTVLRGLREAAASLTGDTSSEWLTAIVTVMDDGGSSGRLRESLGVLPPGDIRNCLGALVREPSVLSAIFHDRMSGDGGGAGHPIGNLLLAALSTTEGDLLRAAQTLGAHLNVSGRVLPATLENVHLTAHFDDGSAVRGETAIAAKRGRIRRLMLDRPVRPVPEVIEALINADLVVVGPGSLYTSILPNLLVDGVAATIQGLRATRVYVANLMTEPGETDGFSLRDHLKALYEHTGYDLFDYILVNRAPIPSDALELYAADGAQLVEIGPGSLDSTAARIVAADLATVTPCGQIRHSPSAVGFALHTLCAGRDSRHSGPAIQ
jgi:uncharacterized cofD-like protein